MFVPLPFHSQAKPPAALVQLKKQMELKKIDDEKVKQNSAQDNDFEKRYQEMAQERKRQKEGRGDQKVHLTIIRFTGSRRAKLLYSTAPSLVFEFPRFRCSTLGLYQLGFM